MIPIRCRHIDLAARTDVALGRLDRIANLGLVGGTGALEGIDCEHHPYVIAFRADVQQALTEAAISHCWMLKRLFPKTLRIIAAIAAQERLPLLFLVALRFRMGTLNKGPSLCEVESWRVRERRKRRC